MGVIVEVDLVLELEKGDVILVSATVEIGMNERLDDFDLLFAALIRGQIVLAGDDHGPALQSTAWDNNNVSMGVWSR